MIVPGSPNAMLLANAGDPLDEYGVIARSIRLRSSVSAALNRAFAAAGNRKTWSLRTCYKIGVMSAHKSFFSVDANNFFRHRSTDTLQITFGGTNAIETAAEFRDPAAHMDVLLVVDTTQATSTDRIKIYVNGVQQTLGIVSGSYPAQNADLAFNNNVAHSIGGLAGNLMDGLLSHFAFVDGVALTPSAFGLFHPRTGQWRPKSRGAIKAVVDAGGANSFFLPFDDITNLTTLCADASSKGNNWTASNVSLTAGATYDSMLDTPTNNFPTLNPVMQEGTTYGDGLTLNANLSQNCVATSYDQTIATFGAATGKWYWEVTFTAGSDAVSFIGVRQSPDSGIGGFVQRNGTLLGLSGAALPGWANGTVVGVALDCDAGTVAFYYNGALQGGSARSITSWSAGMHFLPAQGNQVHTAHVNFGQQGFAYSPPAGFKALCTKNMVKPTGSVQRPSLGFRSLLDTGANIKAAAEAVFPNAFIEWIKDRANANNHQLIDNVRGSNAVLRSNTTDVETVYAAPAGSSVAWLWKTGGAAVANNDGSIGSQVSANRDIGLSVVTWAGTGANGTVGHGLGATPKLIISKNRDYNLGSWNTWASVMAGTHRLLLDSSGAQASVPTAWNSTVPNSSVFSVGSLNSINDPGNRIVAYCFAEVPGFSKFGSYTGNGSAAGPFVNCGFQPRFVMIKRLDAAENWCILDTTRDTYNEATRTLCPNLTNAEGSNTIDIVSNGFKVAQAGAQVNTSGGTYIYAAFAEFPFRYANAR